MSLCYLTSYETDLVMGYIHLAFNLVSDELAFILNYFPGVSCKNLILAYQDR